jgi:hypothetical protein
MVEWPAQKMRKARVVNADRQRRSLRLPNYDYTQAGAYFVTICTLLRTCHS